MKKKTITIIVAVLITILIIILGSILIKNNQSEREKIPNNYIAVFNGGEGNVTYSTYVYKIDNGKENSGFKYINTKSTMITSKSKEPIVKITDKGEVGWTDDVFSVAKKNKAYAYVLSDGKQYTIEEFQKIFIMD